MQYRCDEKDCEFPVNIHTPMTISKHVEQEALLRSSGIFAVNVLCESGHACTGRALGGAFRVTVAPGWDDVALDTP
jgi:hypothetical protein